jgi:hypothetical protein
MIARDLLPARLQSLLDAGEEFGRGDAESWTEAK